MQSLDHTVTDKQDVRHMTNVQMARLGVRLLEAEDLVLQCIVCGETWIPDTDSTGKLAFNYWRCPRRCNE
jgi:hypothetical protein